MAHQYNNEEQKIIEATPFSRASVTLHKKRFRLRPLPVLIGTLFLVLFMAVLFLFTAKAVRFNILPAPDQLTFTSGLFHYQVGERYLMLQGQYSIRASLIGYHDLTADIVVGTANDQGFEFSLKKLPGILFIDVDEATTVFIDQQPLGQSPLRIDQIEAGSHDIVLQSKRYLRYEDEIEIEGKRIEQHFTAELTPAWANVQLSSEPSDAAVFVDGEKVGATPANIEILEGEHQVELKKAGYKVWLSQLSVTHGQDQQLPSVNLVKSDGKVTIHTQPSGVNVTIAKRYRGQSPLSVSLAPGSSYEVMLSKAGYEPQTRNIKVKPDEDISLQLTLKPVVGVIRLQVQPSGGQLFIDGKPAGEPSQQLSLTASRHQIKITKKGFATYETTVTPQPALAQQLMVTLQTVDEAKIAAIPQTIKSADDQILNLILPDKLKMGAGRRERGRRSNEIQKDVQLTRGYYLASKEVSNKQFKSFDVSHDSGVYGRALLNQDDRPAVNVAWDEAAKFCNWLSAKDGLPAAYEHKNGVWQLTTPLNTGYRMPTEAEWAWAARYASGEQPDRFPWGMRMPPPPDSGNFADETAAGMVPYYIVGYNDGFRGPAPVGSYNANQFGIYDLAGNVSEWVNDFYSVELQKKLLVDPLGPDTGDFHVIRGSNYTNGRFSELRWTYRDYGAAPRRDVGFRIARYVK